jgi:hypothetical protein
MSVLIDVYMFSSFRGGCEILGGVGQNKKAARVDYPAASGE